VSSRVGSFDDADVERRLPFEVDGARKPMADGFEMTPDCPDNRDANDERPCLALASRRAGSP
jgi:peptide/nickel transport system substrate-binding protein